MLYNLMVAICVIAVVAILSVLAINLNEVKAVSKPLGIIMPAEKVTMAVVAFFHLSAALISKLI